MRFATLLALAYFAAGIAPASALKIAAVGAVSKSQPSDSAYQPKNAFGGGGLIEFGLGPLFGLEIGALLVPRKYEVTRVTPASETVTTEQKMVEIPLVFRAYLGKVLSLGVGAYYTSYTGNFETSTKNNVTGAITNSSQTYAAAGRSESDYGFVSSLGIYLPLMPLLRIVLDGRYTVGVKDNVTGPGDLKFNDIQVLAGLQLGF